MRFGKLRRLDNSIPGFQLAEKYLEATENILRNAARCRDAGSAMLQIRVAAV